MTLGLKTPIHSCQQTQQKIIFDHKVSKRTFNNELKLLVILPMKTTWEELLTVLECKEILGWVPEDQGLSLISPIKFGPWRNLDLLTYWPQFPYLWNTVEEAEVDNVHISFCFWNNFLLSVKNMNPRFQQTQTRIFAGENWTVHLISPSLSWYFQEWRKYPSARLQGLRMRVKMIMNAKHLWLCQPMIGRGRDGRR